MKRIVLIISVLLLPFLSIAQQLTTIKVSARAIHIDKSPEFKAIISLSNTYSSLPSEMTTLDILKKQYKEALEEKGFSWSELKENPNDFGFENMGRDKEGTLYEYRTKSLDKIIKFLKVKSLGVSLISYVSIITIDDDEATKLSKNALNTATSKATIIANVMGKELGDILEIEDLNSHKGEEIETYLYYDKPAAQYIYILNVIFSVK
ncbi:MAG: SIMPL domain-containing protein [Psychroserpens sp.]|uniref:SIMPL domain-containing protein n=1 Tax=Psychroserpens sp. TaxID=2020870 RepID=UPI003CAC2EDD